MQHRIALSHASGLAAEAILEKMSESGIEPDSLVLLDHEIHLGKRLAYGKGHLKLQDQHAYDLSQCALLLMPEGDAELEANALAQGCLLVSHAIDSGTPALFLDSGTDDPEIAFNAQSLRLAGPEVCCLLPALRALDAMQPIEQLNAALMRSVEFHGKRGVDELASQTVNLLNARSIDPVVYPEQIAFNLLPHAVEAELSDDLRRNMGNISYSQTLQSLNLPVFHGFAAGVQLRFGRDIDPADCEKRLKSLDQMIVKRGSASPISDCNQSFSCVISQLEQSPEYRTGIHFWMITDPMRYGLANNYVNVTEFLLKSFL